MSEEYVFIDNIVLNNPLITPIEEQFGEIITVVGLAESPAYETIEVE